MREEIELAKQWLAKAENDLLNADNNLAARNIPFDTVCFHCQQAAEKMLKAYLVANNMPYPFTHDLLVILEKILEVTDKAEHLRQTLIVLNPYAVEVRYPPTARYTPSADEAIEARKSAGQIRQWLESACPILF
ncbi:MAG: HEPN domain-containing protein [Sedimentisphaerales bacterium]|nr:HEPN domain-containing protein [Sedimentisphaerales bacterium]